MYILKFAVAGNPLIFHKRISHVYMYRDTRLGPAGRVVS